MSISFTGFLRSMYVSRNDSRAAFRWVMTGFVFCMIYILFNGMYQLNLYSALMYAFTPPFILYYIYNINTAECSFSKVLPITDSSRVKYTYLTALILLIVHLAAYSLVLSLFDLENVLYNASRGDIAYIIYQNFSDKGSVLSFLQALSVLIAFIPITFMKNDRNWYIGAACILGATVIFDHILLAVGSMPFSFDILHHDPAFSSVCDTSTGYMIYVMYCIFVPLECIGSYMLSLRLADEKTM